VGQAVEAHILLATEMLDTIRNPTAIYISAVRARCDARRCKAPAKVLVEATPAAGAGPHGPFSDAELRDKFRAGFFRGHLPCGHPGLELDPDYNTVELITRCLW
jgi:hypothetical protein